MTTDAAACDLLPALRGGGREVSADRRDKLAVLIEAWLIASCRSDHTYRAYRSDMLAWLAWCDETGVYPLDASRDDVNAWMRVVERRPLDRTGRPPEESTLARWMSTVSSFYSFAVDEGGAARSPVPTRGRPKASRESSTVGLSREEAVAVLRRLRDETDRDRALILVLLLDGLRCSELIDLDRASLGHDSGQAVLRVRGKGRKTRTIVAAPPVVEAVFAMLDDVAAGAGVARSELSGDAPLFPGDTAGRLSRWQVLRIVKRIVRAAGVASFRDITPHSLRHTCITLMRDAGEDIHRVADHAGHATVSTTERYDRARGRLARTPVHGLVKLLDAAD